MISWDSEISGASIRWKIIISRWIAVDFKFRYFFDPRELPNFPLTSSWAWEIKLHGYSPVMSTFGELKSFLSFDLVIVLCSSDFSQVAAEEIYKNKIFSTLDGHTHIKRWKFPACKFWLSHHLITSNSKSSFTCSWRDIPPFPATWTLSSRCISPFCSDSPIRIHSAYWRYCDEDVEKANLLDYSLSSLQGSRDLRRI